MGQGQIIGVVLLCFGLLCACFATLLDYWCYVRITKGKEHPKGRAEYFGLWTHCDLFHKNGVLTKDCKSWDVYSQQTKISLPWLHMCQALMIVGIVLYGCAFLAALVCIRTSQQTRSCAYLSVCGGLSCILTAFVFNYNKASVISVPSHPILHAAFGLDISSVCFSSIAVYFLWRHTHAAGYQNIDVL